MAVSIRGYDYVIIEGYFRYLQKLAKSLGIEVPEAYLTVLVVFIFIHSYLYLSSVPIPAKSSRVTILKPRSAQIDIEHHLNLYHRIVKVRNEYSNRCKNKKSRFSHFNLVCKS